MSLRAWFGVGALWCLAVSCSRSPAYAVGDRVIVEQEGKGYEAKVASVDGDKIKVTYVDYKEDEVVTPERVRAKIAAAGALKPATGDKLLVKQGKTVYEAKLLGEAKGGKLKVAYDGYDETENVAPDRVLAMAPKDGLILNKKPSGSSSGASPGGSGAAKPAAGAAEENLNEEQKKCKDKQATDARWVFCAKSGQEAWGVCVRTDIDPQHCGKCFYHCKAGDPCDPNVSGGPLCRDSNETTTLYQPDYTY